MNLISKYDRQNQFEVLVNTFNQIDYAWSNEIDLSRIDAEKIDKIVVSGLGGSAIGGELLQNFLIGELDKPFIVNRNYGLPAFADENTLVIASSYSGNTEETLSSLESALQRGCQIITVSTGGEVERTAVRNNIPFVKLLKGFQPRYALCINFFTLLKVFQLLKFVESHDSLVESIKDQVKTNGIKYSQAENPALKQAAELIGHIPVIYSVSDYTSAVGTRLKGQFNENSKIHAYYNALPEFNHNEIIGWESHSESSFRAKVIFILDKEYHPRIKQRIDITAKLIEESGTEIVYLESEYASFKERLIDLIYFGDWVSYYLAILRKADPTEIKYINFLKEKLAENST
jgi:glucose/mannose-6-phosphate isomerase